MTCSDNKGLHSLRSTPLEGIYVQYCKLDQKPMLGSSQEISTRKSTTDVLLDRYVDRLLNIYVCIALTRSQRCFFGQWTIVNTETHNLPKHGEERTSECSALKGDASMSPTLRSREHHQRWAVSTLRAR